MTAPCGWTPTTGCCTDWDTFDPAVQSAALEWAVDILWRLSGRRYGACEVTVRPCYVKCVPQTWQTYGVWMESWGYGGAGWGWFPYIDMQGTWRNCGCCGICCCGPSCEIFLPGPVESVTSIKIDNVALATGWRVDNKQWLVRNDGQCWPECQNFDVPADSTDNTFVVTYTRGVPVPASGNIAAGALACEYAKFCVGGECALSPQITSVSRDGVSWQVMTAGSDGDKYPTGVAVVDQWLRAVNPSGLRQRPRVSSPDTPITRQTSQVA
jgi:hypothetical protein